MVHCLHPSEPNPKLAPFSVGCWMFNEKSRHSPLQKWKQHSAAFMWVVESEWHLWWEEARRWMWMRMRRGGRKRVMKEYHGGWCVVGLLWLCCWWKKRGRESVQIVFDTRQNKYTQFGIKRWGEKEKRKKTGQRQMGTRLWKWKDWIRGTILYSCVTITKCQLKAFRGFLIEDFHFRFYFAKIGSSLVGNTRHSLFSAASMQKIRVVLRWIPIQRLRLPSRVVLLQQR